MTITWKPRDSRGHYLASKDVHTTLGPEDWDDTCRHQTKPAELSPSAETFGHEPTSSDVDYWGETTDNPPVCARCTHTVRAWLPVVIGQRPDGSVITRDAEQRTAFEVAVLWPCTSAVVLGLAPRPCPHCKGNGSDPDDKGDWIPEAGMYNPYSVAPCPECHGTGQAVADSR